MKQHGVVAAGDMTKLALPGTQARILVDNKLQYDSLALGSSATKASWQGAIFGPFRVPSLAIHGTTRLQSSDDPTGKARNLGQRVLASLCTDLGDQIWDPRVVYETA